MFKPLAAGLAVALSVSVVVAVGVGDVIGIAWVLIDKVCG